MGLTGGLPELAQVVALGDLRSDVVRGRETRAQQVPPRSATRHSTVLALAPVFCRFGDAEPGAHARRLIKSTDRKPDGEQQIEEMIPSLNSAIIVAIGALVASGCAREHGHPPVDAPKDVTRAETQAPATISSDNPPAYVARVSATRPPRDLDDPSRDGWDTEVFSTKALEQLNQLIQGIWSSQQFDATTILTADAKCSPLRPTKTQVFYADGRLKSETGANNSDTADSAANINDAFTHLKPAVDGVKLVRYKFKIIRVEPNRDVVATRQLGSLVWRSGHAIVEQHFTWTIHWQNNRRHDPPKIRSIFLETFEETSSTAADDSSPLFVDCTESALGKNPCYQQQFLHGFNYWLERIQDTEYYPLLGSPGIAIGDVNGDGLDDIYVCQEGSLPNRLFVQNADGSATDTSQSSQTDWLERTRSALLIDVDNDGDQDLVVAMIGCLVFAANDGKGAFTVKTTLPCEHDTMSLSAADFDQDADLDVYVCGHSPSQQLLSSGDESVAAVNARVVYHDANNAAQNALFRNDIDGADKSDWRFTDVTVQVGLDENNHRFSFASAWEDYDNDGDQDLYVANDFGPNNLYQNLLREEGTARFVDVAAKRNAADRASGMSIVWGDVNRDGRMDAYVSNMFSAAGSRITAQKQFKPDASQEVVERLKRFARGNTLLYNTPSGFEDTSVDAGVTVGRWAWGSAFVDINNDGWDDLFVANGFITGKQEGDL